MSRDTAQADACKMEHLLSSETGRRLVCLMRCILNDEEREALVRDAMTRFNPECKFVEECLDLDEEGGCQAEESA